MNLNPPPQLELELNPTRHSRPVAARPFRAPRAVWWFDHMRRIVDRAMDWPPAAPSQPGQFKVN